MIPEYYSLNEYLKHTYGKKMYKLSLDGGMTCPNRDGKTGISGCTFCSAGGSGDFSGLSVIKKHNNIISDNALCQTRCYKKEYDPLPDIDLQIKAAKELISSKYTGDNYIAYFQSYSNTYAQAGYLNRLYTQVIARPEIKILSIATRPDCIDESTIKILDKLNKIKPVWIELGLQTSNEESARRIRRGYDNSVYESTLRKLNSIGIKVITHMIIGLPGETGNDMINTAKYISNNNSWGIKLQLLHVLKHTDLANEYSSGSFSTLSLEEYAKILSEIIMHLPKDMVVHRLTGDGPKNLLIAPLWSSDKKRVYNYIIKYFKDNNIQQGILNNSNKGLQQ